MIKDCDEEGKLVCPTDPAERDQLRKDCLKHATVRKTIAETFVFFQSSSSESIEEESPFRSTGMACFAEEVLVEDSLYVDVSIVDSFRSKFNISSTGYEEDVVMLSCDIDERIYDQEMAGDRDESYIMYTAVLEEFGTKIPFTPFEMDVLKFINVAPSQIRPNS